MFLLPDVQDQWTSVRAELAALSGCFWLRSEEDCARLAASGSGKLVLPSSSLAAGLPVALYSYQLGFVPVTWQSRPTSRDPRNLLVTRISSKADLAMLAKIPAQSRQILVLVGDLGFDWEPERSELLAQMGYPEHLPSSVPVSPVRDGVVLDKGQRFVFVSADGAFTTGFEAQVLRYAKFFLPLFFGSGVAWLGDWELDMVQAGARLYYHDCVAVTAKSHRIEKKARAMNRRGFEAQVDYLLENFGPKRAATEIAEQLGVL